MAFLFKLFNEKVSVEMQTVERSHKEEKSCFFFYRNMIVQQRHIAIRLDRNCVPVLFSSNLNFEKKKKLR